MKLYDKFRKLKTSTKIGLATSAIYSTTALALPAYAAVKEQPKPVVVQPVNLEGVNTVEQADALFHSKLEEYCVDKELNLGEVKNLRSILLKENQLLSKNQVEKKDAVAEALYKQILDRKEKIRQVKEKRYGILKEPEFDISERRKEIESLLEKEYPGLFDKKNAKLNVTYPITAHISHKPAYDLIEGTAKEVLSLFDSNHQDAFLVDISNNNSGLSLKNAAQLFRTMAYYEEGLKKVKGLEKDLEDFKLKNKDILEKLSKPSKNVKFALGSSHGLIEVCESLSNYIRYKDSADEFIEKFEDLNKYYSVSVLGWVLKESKDSPSWKRFHEVLDNKNRKSIEKTLNQYLASEGLEAKVASLKNPTDVHRFFGIDNDIFQLIFVMSNFFITPIIRNVFVRKYMDDGGDEKYTFSVGAGLGNGFLGILVIDGLHPWAFWARMASPVLIQPLKRAFKLREW